MKQFSLEKYLENPSRKVVTRDGRNVRIICWDIKSNTPIIAAIQWNDEREDCYFYNTIGRCANNVAEIELFFADEEEELTEFEKEVKDLMNSCCNEIGETIITDEWAKDAASVLLDLARNEILRDLPKWKRAIENKEFEKHVCVMDYYMSPFLDTEVNEGDYYIELSDLKTLPKEE